MENSPLTPLNGPGQRIDAHAVADAGTIRLRLCGREWLLHRPADLESLWDAITDDAFTADERLPYWVELWPASLALAVWLEKQQDAIRGKRCLDIGCGLGFTALVGASLGASVLAMDYEPEALAYAAKNAVANAIPAPPSWLAMDWRSPAIQPRCCDVIWGGDVMYENRFVIPVFDFLEHSLSPEGTVWIAEPGRDAYTLFKQTLVAGGWRAKCVAEERVQPLHVQQVPVTVKLWELGRNTS